LAGNGETVGSDETGDIQAGVGGLLGTEDHVDLSPAATTAVCDIGLPCLPVTLVNASGKKKRT
ncbi:MAG: hypothetical protein AAGA23_16260, partial [Pseudomonadota bacterium]